MATEENGDEPKLTVKLRSEIIEPEPFEYSILKPAEPLIEPDDEESMIGLEPEQITIEPEDEEETFEETMESVDIPKVQERKPQREKARKSKIMTSPSEPKSISRLHVELRKHSDARKKTDSAILDIRKELKDLLLIHHATIKYLQKQMTQMRRKIVTIENSRKSTKLKISGKKTSGNKKSKKKINQKKSKKR
jgi:hypothetical protein